MTEPREYRGLADARSGALLHLRLLETTDLHGHVMPFDYHSGQDDRPLGLARLATLIRQARRESPNCLLFDNGDFLQGTPLSDMAGQPDGWTGPHPVIAAMNALDYDAVGLGNHEFNFGLPALGRALESARFPITCANVHALGDTSLPFARPLILERRLTDTAGQAHDLRIGVIGLVPPQISIWDRHHLRGRLHSAGITETARRLVPGLRAAGADLVIALAHSGIDDSPDHPGLENAALPLSLVPGIDAVLAGHSHRLFPGPDHHGLPGVSAEHGSLNGIPAIMAGFAGSHLGLLDLVLMHDPEGWRTIDHRATLRPLQPGSGAPPTPADPAVVK
ncbi:metallophosphoesterase, partial [Roseovarius sp.]